MADSAKPGTSPLEAPALAALTAALEARREEFVALLAGAAASERDLESIELPDPGEQSADRVLAVGFRELSESVSVKHGEELAQIEIALERIASGAYGYCQDCGEAIALNRLQAYPSASRCIKCQTLAERGEARAKL